MRKLMLVQWDIRLGPKALVQFPPEEDFPTKELLLKIWAKHETDNTSNFISEVDTIHKKKYCSLLKNYLNKSKTFFIVLELEIEADERIYQEILENVANDLINNYEKPHFNHVLSETFRAIKNFSELDEIQLFFRIYDETIRIKLLEYLRKGVISKHEVRSILKAKFGYIKLNLDLLLTPFLRLGLIKIKKVPGSSDSIFLVSDVFACRIPPKYKPSNPIVEEKIQNLFKSKQILSDTEIHNLLPIFENVHSFQLIKLLKLNKDKGIAYDIALELVQDKKKILNDLQTANFIHNENDEHVYLLSDIQFQKFQPKYLLPILKERYIEKEISMNQLVTQLEFLIN